MPQFRHTAPQTAAGQKAVQEEYAKDVETRRQQQHERAMAQRATQEPVDPAWVTTIVYLLRNEVDAGRLVQVALPGGRVPVLVEEAYCWAKMLVLRDHKGQRYYVPDPAGVVVICQPPEPVSKEEEAEYFASLDESGPTKTWNQWRADRAAAANEGGEA